MSHSDYDSYEDSVEEAIEDYVEVQAEQEAREQEELAKQKRQYDILLWALIGVSALVGLALLLLLIKPGDNTPTTPPTAGDSSWEQIQAAGRMVVGTSLDYPPFDYRNDQFQPDGFDIALIREIGARLGVQVELKDMAFDGLGGALAIDQIDTAIAAISISPEREARFDFSNVYFVSEDAILANQNSAITSVQSPQQMAGQRIGVQRGSIFENWVQEAVVDSGLTPSSNLFVYEQPDAAVRDLAQQRLDLVMMDRPPADLAVAQGGVKLVGGNLNPQRFAIAVPQGATSFQLQLNQALTAMQNEGRIAQLAQQYLGLPPDQIIPPPTPTATPVVPSTATPLPVVTATPQPCVNGMKYVADLNYDDNNMTTPPPVPPGQPFSKGWRIQNSGTCTWDSGYRLTYVSGNVPAASMGGQPTPVQGLVNPGQQYDMYVNLIAPLTPGVYQGIWQMVDHNNVPFGDRIWVGITVPAPATATPLPTQTPSADISFTVDATNIHQGQCVTFNWSAPSAIAVYFYAQGEDWQHNQVPTSGSRLVCPPTTTTYILRVVRNNGSVEERQITIYVQPAIGQPEIVQFVANPPQITLGQCVNIQWQVRGEVNQVTISANGRPIWDNAPNSGTTQDCPQTLGSMQYSLQATGPGGASQAQDYVNVVDASTATPAPTRPPEQAVIDYFSVAPPHIETNQCVQISWGTSGATWLVRLLRNNVLVLDNADKVGQAQDCVPQAGDYVYELVASNSASQSVSEQQSVLVSEGIPENPLAGKTFSLQSVNGVPVLAGTTVDAAFGHASDINGLASCNTYSATYVLSGSSISIFDIIQSRTACPSPPGIMEQEQAYVTALELARSYQYSLETGTLVMFNAGGGEILRYGEFAR